MTHQSDKDFFESNEMLMEINGVNRNPNKEPSNNQGNPSIPRIETEEELAIDRIREEILAKPIMSGEELLSIPFETNNYLIENFLWKNDIAIILAPEKAGKSFLSFQMAFALTCGEPFLGAYEVARPLNVLYIQAEGSMQETQDRVSRAIQQGGLSWDPKRWGHMFPPALSLDTDEGYEKLASDIQEYNETHNFKPEVIVIDPLYMAMEGDLSDNKAARMFCRNTRRLKDDLNCSFIIAHHQHRGKIDQNGNPIDEGDNAIMGSFVWKAFATHVLRVFYNKKEETRTVTCDTQRNAQVEKRIVLKLIEEPALMLIPVGHKTNNKVEANVVQFLKHNGPYAAADLSKETGLDYQSVRNIYTKLKKNKVIKLSDKRSTKVLYELVKEKK